MNKQVEKKFYKAPRTGRGSDLQAYIREGLKLASNKSGKSLTEFKR